MRVDLNGVKKKEPVQINGRIFWTVILERKGLEGTNSNMEWTGKEWEGQRQDRLSQENDDDLNDEPATENLPHSTTRNPQLISMSGKHICKLDKLRREAGMKLGWVQLHGTVTVNKPHGTTTGPKWAPFQGLWPPRCISVTRRPDMTINSCSGLENC